MNLTDEQESALTSILSWAYNGEPTAFVLSGYAGTGKTTLMKFLIDEIPSSSVVFATVTGKAMNVLQKKLPSGTETSTLHRLLYTPLPDTYALNIKKQLLQMDKNSAEYELLLKEYKKLTDDIAFEDKEDPDIPDLVIVDEASMINQDMLSKLRDLPCQLLLIGDEMQLPPVKSSSVFQTLGVDARLTHVQRQALENPVLKLATCIRENDADFVRQWRTRRFDLDLASQADKIITYTNRSRHRINRMMREARGYTEETPVQGDVMICTSNSPTYSWVNGAECVALSDPRDLEGSLCEMDIEYEGKQRDGQDVYIGECYANYSDIRGTALELRREELQRNTRSMDYGYAVTGHKAQGSEWPTVMLYDDGRWVAKKFGFEQRQRWLYTVITRAQEQLFWVNG